MDRSSAPPGAILPVNAGEQLAHLSQQSHDPWAHRSQGMRCASCMWFAAKGPLGRCRRHAPTMNGYPVVYPTDWCGDHKLDETKVS